MVVITQGNWSLSDPSEGDVPDGSTIEGGNFMQAEPNTPIMVGRTLTIISGNFTNVRIDSNWTVGNVNFCQISRCAHLHPDMVAAGHLAAEIDNCPHVVEVIEIVGGPDVYVYKDTVL